MQFVNTTIHSLSTALNTAAGALKDITPASMSALFTAITGAASNAFASQGENGDTTTTHYGLWVATALTTTLVLASSLLFFCRRTPAPAVPQLPSTPQQPLLTTNAPITSSSSEASSSYSSSSSVTPSLITLHDSTGARINQELMGFHKLANGNFVAAFGGSIFTCGPDFSNFEEIVCSHPFQNDRNKVHVVGNTVYIIDSFITSHDQQAFYLTSYDAETKELAGESCVTLDALEMTHGPNLGKRITFYERTEDGLDIVGTPHGVISIVDGEDVMNYSDASGENNSSVLSVKKYNNNIIAGLANGNVLIFDEDADSIVKLAVDPEMYGTEGHAVTSLQIVGDHLFASYGTTFFPQGKILVWDLKAEPTQTPVLLAPTNSKPPVIASNGLLVFITSAGTIQAWNPATRSLVKEFDLVGMGSSMSAEEKSNVRSASIECSGNRIIVRTRTGLYELPLPSAE